MIRAPPANAKEKMERIIECLKEVDHMRHEDIRILTKWLEEFKEEEL